MTTQRFAHGSPRAPLGSTLGAMVCLVLVLLLALPAAGCSALKGQLPQEEGYNPRLTRFAYLEEGKLVSFAVDTAATRRREKSGFVPFAVGVANLGFPRLTLTRESFTLVDDQGKRYSMATVQEARTLGPLLSYDLRISQDFASVFATRFSAWPQFDSVFFPGTSTDPAFSRRGIVLDRVEIPGRGWIVDMLYFPHPEGTLMDRKYELWLDTEELEEPVYVRLRVK